MATAAITSITSVADRMATSRSRRWRCVEVSALATLRTSRPSLRTGITIAGEGRAGSGGIRLLAAERVVHRVEERFAVLDAEALAEVAGGLGAGCAVGGHVHGDQAGAPHGVVL